MSKRRKIHKVITTCNECEHSKEFQEMCGNTEFCVLCMYRKSPDEDVASPFVLTVSGSKIKDYICIDIPKHCPLEDYVEVENKPEKNE